MVKDSAAYKAAVGALRFFSRLSTVRKDEYAELIEKRTYANKKDLEFLKKEIEKS